MAEYLTLRCCMCPHVESDDRICPGISGTPHPDPSPCRFVKIYQDKRGWQYFVRAGIGGDTFKTFYRKPGKAGKGLLYGHGWRPAPWRNTFDEAQADLNVVAKKKGWMEV